MFWLLFEKVCCFWHVIIPGRCYIFFRKGQKGCKRRNIAEPQILFTQFLYSLHRERWKRILQGLKSAKLFDTMSKFPSKSLDFLVSDHGTLSVRWDFSNTPRPNHSFPQCIQRELIIIDVLHFHTLICGHLKKTFNNERTHFRNL